MPAINRSVYIFIAILVLSASSFANSGCQLNLQLAKPSSRQPAVTPSPVSQQPVTTTVQVQTPVSLPPTPPPALGIASGAPVDEQSAAGAIIPIVEQGLPKGPRKPPPTRIIISSIGVDAKVIPLGTHYNELGQLVWDTAPFAVGHHQGTANPGEKGNVVLSGHISSSKEGAVFHRLPEIEVGDGVVVITADKNYVYQVVDKRVVEPSQVDVMNSTDDFILTLITCVPDGIYSHRLVVTAKQA